MNKLSKQYVRIAALVITVIFATTLTASPALSRDRHSSLKGYQRSSHVRIVKHGDALPALIVTGILAGITLSIIDSAASSRSSRCYGTSQNPERVAPVDTYSQAVRTGSVVVTAQLLNVRSGPSLRDHAILQVPNGTVLSVHGNASGWYYVKMPNNLYGWVMARYTTPLGYPANG